MNDPAQRMNLNQRQNETEESAHQTQSDTTILEFHSAEEILRHDAATVDVPEGIASQLVESTRSLPPTPWWRRWFDG